MPVKDDPVDKEGFGLVFLRQHYLNFHPLQQTFVE